MRMLQNELIAGGSLIYAILDYSKRNQNLVNFLI